MGRDALTGMETQRQERRRKVLRLYIFKLTAGGFNIISDLPQNFVILQDNPEN